ncbi:class I SAM-dependent DNA methyltransferase [Streptomyces sp. NPDC090499]|uniref:class I SAM-dependent DNA methyltransferase n=1 Tax=Streptomyces sp. NPDC090499 TaxID=3365965 RepID=UPI00381D4B1B
MHGTTESAAPRHAISFPPVEPETVRAEQWTFDLMEDGVRTSIRAHDYPEIFRRPGLYEQLFHERLRCASPRTARDALLSELRDHGADIHALRVLDLGAGNGMVGELLTAARVVGLDISEAARDACVRDRPHAYDAYYVADMTDPGEDLLKQLDQWGLDALVCVSALGFGDIPVAAFVNAYNVVADGAWVVFNVKETFVADDDRTGFARLVSGIMGSGALRVHRMERYRHRYSIDGEPLFYYLFVGRKVHDLPLDPGWGGHTAGGAFPGRTLP